MASIGGAVAGGAIGNAILPGIGGIIGAAIGSSAGGIIDSMYVYPAVFGRDKPLDGLKLDDLQLQTASEGSPLRFCVGPDNRVAGTIIWMSNVRSKRKSSGGKNGPSNYTYYVSLAIAICEGELSSVDKIWADSKLIWQKSTGDPGNNGTIVGTLLTHTGHIQGLATLNVELSNNPGDAVHLKKGDHFKLVGRSGTVYEVTADVDIAQGALGSISIKPGVDFIIPAGTQISLVDWTDAFATSFTVYKGSTTQNADPVMEAALGAGNVPAYRGVAYAVIEDFILSPFGNRIPNFTFKCAAQTSKTVASAISDFVLRSGLQAGDFDVTKVSGNISAYNVSGPQPVGKSLEPLMLAYNVDVQEKNTKLVFFTRTNRDVINVFESELGAHEHGETLPPPFTINDLSGFDLPNELTVSFLDKKNGQQKGTARERRIDSITQTVDNIDLPVVLEHKDARNIANRLLWDAWRERQSAEFTLPPSRLGVQEGDLLVVPFQTETYNVRVMDVKLGANFTVEIQGRIESYATDDRDSVSEDLPTSDLPVYTPAPIQMHYADIPSLTDGEVRSWGLYIAVCSQDPTGEWRGADVYYDKTDASIAQGRKLVIAKEATMGVANTVLATGQSDSWDDSSTVDISMWNGALTASTDIDVLNGANRIIIQNGATGTSEVVGFVNATLVGTDAVHGGPIYRLSRLLRGLRNTTGSMASHAVGDLCTLVNEAIYFATLTAADFNKPINWRAVPAGGIIANYISESRTFLARTLKPWSVYDITISPSLPYRQQEQPSGFSVNVTWKWKRRTRAIDRLFTQASDPDLLNPIVETPEKYIFELFDPTGAAVAYKVIVEGTTSITLTNAQLDTIYAPFYPTGGLFDPQWGVDPLIARITMVSPLVGRGDPVTFTG